MNRRGHLSSKIPQVKLRPVPIGAGAGGSSSSRSGKQREASPMNEMDQEILRRAMADTEDEETSTAALRKSSKPWKGVVITFTGVDNKPHYTQLAKELGASVESALTVHVTHVVAIGYGSAKYGYAVEHGLPVMKPSWIEESYNTWLGGNELDVEEEQRSHRLLAFEGLRISMSGVEPLDRRKQLIKFITSNGGLYSKDLDRHCTHLISAKPTSEPRQSEKIRWALREIAELEARKRRGVKEDVEPMKIVYEEWVWDCVHYQGRWKEDAYDARKPRRGGKVNAEDVINGTSHKPEERRPVAVEAGQPVATSAADNAEPAAIRKRKREGLNSLVGELISTTSVKTESSPAPDGHNDQSPLLPPPEDKPEPLKRLEPERKSSMLHLSRSTSFAATAGPSKTSVLPSSDRTDSMPPTAVAHAVVDAAPQQGGSSRFFDGLRFSHVIKEQCEGLENALKKHGGVLVTEAERLEGEKVDFVIVRLCSDVRPVIREGEETTVVTECWVEGCCFEERLLSPNDHIVFKPLPAPMPVEGTSKLLVHLSGFSAENTVYMRRLLRAIGGTLSVKLNRQTTHLVSVPTVGQKVEKAREWGVIVVKDTWLITMARTGKLEPDENHRHTFLAPAVVRLASRTNDLTANFSTVSDLGDSVDFNRRNPRSSPSRPPNSQLGTAGVSPSRMLKPSPTHIDDQPAAPHSVAGGSRTTLRGDSADPTHALSPPKPETERLLNSASSFPAPFPATTEKLARYASAPANPESLSSNSGEASLGSRAASMGSLGMGKGKEMTEVLRQLAEKGGGTPSGSKMVARRSRPSKLKGNSTTRSPLNVTASVSASPASRRSSPPSPADFNEDVDQQSEHGSLGPGGGEIDESVRVQYIDANSARERRKIMAAMFDEGDREGGTKRAKRK
ncbi:hypothetical protein CI109_100230 [Kwoniella shandongensis]|uniref:Uncharacterized protein n=1 Tax=Kwoniella shandongensis TaxID=1734106 RepID=A0A5M6BTB2_9TREE|nr:uncharacterized protein CI109_006235 [Kwoniella shandongensis]KAA5525431.1 hypothetical protein CI109_006235 [Kwoniella shandongensis]